MRRALVATLALSLSAAPLGVFLTLRRMSLLGDALSHAVLPGVAIGFMLAGLSLSAMALGGVIAGMLVAGIAGLIRGQMAEASACFERAAAVFRGLGQHRHAAQTQVPRIMALATFSGLGLYWPLCTSLVNCSILAARSGDTV